MADLRRRAAVQRADALFRGRAGAGGSGLGEQDTPAPLDLAPNRDEASGGETERATGVRVACWTARGIKPLSQQENIMSERIASAVFDSREEAERALTELRSAGIQENSIS